MQKVIESPSLGRPSAEVKDPGVLRFLLALLANLAELFRGYGYRMNRLLPKDGSEGLEPFTVATRPTASSVPGAIIYVSDGGAGAKFQGSDGAAWVNLG